MLRKRMFALVAVSALSTTGWAFADDKLPKALSFRPRQADVTYDKVAPADIEKCSIEAITRSDGEGFWLTGPGGQPLRWFVDTNGDKKPDRWCYFGNGVEVYRESDTNFNGTADEYRWLNTEGMRWGVDENEDGTIDRWKSISAEEVSSELVRAIADNDQARFERLLLTEKELKSLSLGDTLSESVRSRVKSAQEKFSKWVAQQKAVTKSSQWTNFGADKPGVVPAGTEKSTKDIVVYENAVALFSDNGEAKQLIVGTMIQVDGTWRLASLPRLIGDETTTEESGVFFSASFNGRSMSSVADSNSGMSKSLEALVNQLQDIDKKLASESDKETWHAKRADVIEKLVSSSETAAEQTTWIEQFAETVSAAAQVGEYAGGIDRLKDFTRKLQEAKASPERIAYVVFRTMTAEQNVMMNAPDAKPEELNKKYLESLGKFVETYPESADSAEAMLQLALAAEFTGEVKDAQQWYTKASKAFPTTDSGKKATGALNRLNLVGKPFAISGNTLDGRAFKSSELKDAPTVYYFWATWCDTCKTDMRAIKELQAKFAKSKVRVVGVNFDKDPAKASQFLKENSFPFIHLNDKGGLDSTLAMNYGLLTLPMTFLVDKDGKVVKTGVHWTDLEQMLQGLTK